jgi:hypothetical protein
MLIEKKNSMIVPKWIHVDASVCLCVGGKAGRRFNLWVTAI